MDNSINYINYNSSTNSMKITFSYNTKSNNYEYFTFVDDLNYYDYSKIIVLKEGVLEDTRLVADTEDAIEEYVYENIDRDFIRDAGSDIESWVIEKGYDICYKIISQAICDEDYSLGTRDIDEVVDELYSLVKFDSVFEIIDDIANAPITFEEKLADVGMSIHDFI